jgi:hypothetical protein
MPNRPICAEDALLSETPMPPEQILRYLDRIGLRDAVPPPPTLETLRRLNREQGISIVMVSSEQEELRSICDRIAIVCKGAVVDILPPDAGDADFGLAMSGIKPERGGEAHG